MSLETVGELIDESISVQISERAKRLRLAAIERALTPKEWSIVEAVADEGSVQGAAIRCGVHRNTVTRALVKARQA